MKREQNREMPRLTTSIKIDPEVWKEAKIGAIRHDLTVSELLEDAVKEWIKKKEKK